MRILVVEKDASLGDSIKGFLEGWGHEAHHCTRGREALRMFKSGCHDLVIMEVMPPDMTGERLISKLKEVSPTARIVAMTGNNSRELEARIRERGILYYMVKPFETENLRSLLEHLAKRHAKPPDWAEWRVLS
ncbi:MAG: response regulator [Desulfatiglandales bacterium]|jgi:DNA-binding response OmpR family regulator